MTIITLLEAADRIQRHGPARIVVDADGTAVLPSQSELPVDVVFIRDDGWTLGAPSQFETVAYQLWSDHWIGVMFSGDVAPTLISNYQFFNLPREGV